MSKHPFTEDLYLKLVDEEDARVCKAIEYRACNEVPGNFLLTIASQFFSKLGDAVANAKVVLPWVLESMHAPLLFLGFLVPIRESGALIPQLFIAGYVRRLPVRKWVWVFGSLMQAAAMMGIGLAAWQLEGATGGWTVISLLTLFALARGLASVAAKDVVGKTIPKTRRGQLTGWSASAAGLVSVGLGVILIFHDIEGASPYGILLAGGGVLWVLAALIYRHVKEFPGETDGGANGINHAIAQLKVLRTDQPFRRFVITRALLLCSALTAPYYVVLAQQSLGNVSWLLGLFITADGLASLLSAPFWGRFADVSSRRVMIVGAVTTASLGLAVFLLDQLWHETLAQPWLLPLVYFLLSVAHQGIRVGRKTYLLDMGDGSKRTTYVAVSNTVIGVILLLTGLVGALAAASGATFVVLLLSLLGLGGAWMATTLPDVE